MKKFLAQLDFNSLNNIARDIGLAHLTKTSKINEIAKYYRAYGSTWRDLASRYGIPTES